MVDGMGCGILFSFTWVSISLFLVFASGFKLGLSLTTGLWLDGLKLDWNLTGQVGMGMGKWLSGRLISAGFYDRYH